MKEYVCNFQITMNNIFLWEIEKPWEDVFNNRLCIWLWEVVLSSEFGLEVATITELSYDIAIAIGSKDLEAL